MLKAQEDGPPATPVAEYQLASTPRHDTYAVDDAASATVKTERDGDAVSDDDITSAAVVNEWVDVVVASPREEDSGFTETHKDHVRATKPPSTEDATANDLEAKDDDLDDDDGEEEEEDDDDDEEEDEAYRVISLHDAAANEERGFVGNTVITSRFTLWNFIPKLLFYEFSKLANAYFLLISVMQTIKPISNTGGFPASLPALMIIVVIDMFFACLEDYKRHQADHIANELPCRAWDRTNQCFTASKWHLLRVGDVVKVANREAIPADLVILGSWEPDPLHPAGICYVETKSLDGETNLKLRQGLEVTYTLLSGQPREDAAGNRGRAQSAGPNQSQCDVEDPSVAAALASLRGTLVCEQPNNAIHRFQGTLQLDMKTNGTEKDRANDMPVQEVIRTTSVLLRGSTLRNTEYIYGLVVNTGPDTKIMMASSTTPIKWSNMELRLNQQIAYICALMIVLCVTGATVSLVWNAAHLNGESMAKGAWYLFDANTTAVTSPVGHFFLQLLYYFLLLNSFIPVSLYVSMTSVKFLQSYFMNNDLEMYHAESDTPCQVRTMSLNEELGQIDYIFSDKTGTLTCNVMEFRKCSIRGVAYGHGETEVGIAAKQRQLAENGVIGDDAEAMLKQDDDAVGAEDHHVKAPFVNYRDDSIFDAMRPNGDTAKGGANDDDDDDDCEDESGDRFESDAEKQAAAIEAFFEHLAVCHTVMPEHAADGSVRLSASSPDEQALVAAAACFGFKFAARSPGRAVVEYVPCLPKQKPEVSAELPLGDGAAHDETKKENAEVPASVTPPVHPRGEYEILEVLEFNSTRKRMSVIMRSPRGDLTLLCKGADTVMYERLRPTSDPHVLGVRQATLQHMEQFASEGLRTLVIGTSRVSPAFYQEWVQRYRAAINDMKQIELRRLGDDNAIDRCMEEIEVNLDVLGATAIEDRLQAEVPNTIFKLRQASIKIWMLTGDKEETAINIGFACRLLSPEIERIVISADTHPDLDTITSELERYAHQRGPLDDRISVALKRPPSMTTPTAATMSSDDSIVEGERSRHLTRIESMATIQEADSQDGLALVIDGETLELVLAECPLLFLSVALQCVAVIACRVSPAQKAQLVRLVRDHNPKMRTLAIGDGANDVSMIQAAHVGVGISGQEGMQAANSSDYAIAQFRFLSKLLLVHGRWNYVRMGKLILYIFYKNVMMNLTQFWYMIFTGFSGQKFFLEWGLQGYNLLFTALPIVLVSTLEQDVPAALAHEYPVLYRVGQENSRFNTRIVWGWITSCIVESLVISFGTIFGLDLLSDWGDTPNMWVYGCVAFTVVVLVVSLKLCLHQEMWWPTHGLVYVVSIALWIATAAFISNGSSISSAYWNGVFSEVFGSRVVWLLIPLLVVTALLRDFLWKSYIRAFHCSYKHLAQEVHSFGLQRFANELLAFPPPETMPAHVTEALRQRGRRRWCLPTGKGKEDDSDPPYTSELEGGGATTEEAERPRALSKPTAKVMGLVKRPKSKSAADILANNTAQNAGLSGPNSRLGMSRRSATRGSAFSYDAESVMVESFMATERFRGRSASDARPLFRRHASRGSMAFQAFLAAATNGAFLHRPSVVPSAASSPRVRYDSTDSATGNQTLDTESTPRQQSMGNVFRGARHSLGRRRFFSSAALGPDNATNGSTVTETEGSRRDRASRRSRRSRQRTPSAENAITNMTTAPSPSVEVDPVAVPNDSRAPHLVRRYTAQSRAELRYQMSE